MSTDAPAVDVPPVFAAVVGQQRAVNLLAGSLARPVHAYLFVGPPGSGKREAARAFASALLCAHGGDGTCRDCRLAHDRAHPDVVEIERVGPAISAEQAAEIVRLAALSPIEARRKVLVLHEFHLLRPEAASRLLKTIEEPNPSTVFVVLADDVPPELVTIASRCVRVDFVPLDAGTIESVLVASGVDESHARAAALASGGDLSRARLLAVDRHLAARRAAFAAVPSRLDGRGATVAAIVDELLALIEEAGATLRDRQQQELVDLAELIERYGERGSGKRSLEERHKREQRRHRADELRSGLAVLAGAYRDRALAGGGRHGAEVLAAVTTVHEAIEAIGRNPNEALLLQALLLRLPAT